MDYEPIFAFAPWHLPELDEAEDASELRFPMDRAVGVVMTRQPKGEWVDHAPAYGRISVPDGVEIGVRWDASSPFDRDVIDGLPASRVKLMDLEWSDVSDDSIAAILRFDLKELRLGHTRITDAAMSTIGLVSSLRSLSLRGTSVSDASAIHLCGIPQLETLDLAATRITDETLEVIGKSKSLRTLDISANPWPRITDKGIDRLRGISSLRSLSLAWTDLTDWHLLAVAGLKGLQTLDLSGTRVTDAGIGSLTSLPLKSLTLNVAPGVTNVWMNNLRRMASLETLILHDTCVDNLGVFDLWAVNPNCSVNGITQPHWQAGALSGRWAASEPITEGLAQ